MVRFESPSTIVVYFSLFCALAGLVSIPFTPWALPGPLDAAMLVGAGIFGGIGQVTMTQSFRHADASLIAPFDYTSMIWALIVSLVVFNTWPSAHHAGRHRDRHRAPGSSSSTASTASASSAAARSRRRRRHAAVLNLRSPLNPPRRRPSCGA